MKNYWFSESSTKCEATTMLLVGLAWGNGWILVGFAALVLGAAIDGIWGRC